MEESRKPEPGTFRRLAFPLAVAAVVALHVGLCLHFLPPGIVFGDQPIAWFDFELHSTEVWTVTEALDGWGKSWAWTPSLMAGYPEGTVSDLGSKGLELFVFALWKLGLPRALAFNMFALLAHLLLLPVVYLSARLFDLGRWTSLLAMLMASLLWYFDSLAHSVWWVGMVSYAMVSYEFLLPMGLFRRYLAGFRPAHLVLLVLSLSLAHLIHPLVFTCLVVPMCCMYARSFRSMPWHVHAGTVAALLLAVAVNVWWLAVVLRFWGDIVPVDAFFQGTLLHLVTDILGIEHDQAVTGWCGVRTAFRTLLLAAAVVCLVGWRGRRDDRFLPLAAGLGTAAAIAYLGSHTWVLAQTQPYRHIMPAMMLAVLPAASLVEQIVRNRTLSRLPGPSLGALVVAGVLVLSSLARDVAGTFPGGQPSEDCPPRNNHCRHAPLRSEYEFLVERLDRLDHSQGRILVEDWILAEHLARRSGAHVLGGFPHRSTEHTAASLFARMERDRTVDIERYLEDYAVRWVLLNNPHPELEERDDLLVRLGSVPYCTDDTVRRHILYRVVGKTSFFAAGSGQVEAGLNRIDVRSTDPDTDLVLRFHFLETFECRPECTMEREPVRGDPIGFIRIPAPHPQDLVMENAY